MSLHEVAAAGTAPDADPQAASSSDYAEIVTLSAPAWRDRPGEVVYDAGPQSTYSQEPHYDAVPAPNRSASTYSTVDKTTQDGRDGNAVYSMPLTATQATTSADGAYDMPLGATVVTTTPGYGSLKAAPQHGTVNGRSSGRRQVASGVAYEALDWGHDGTVAEPAYAEVLGGFGEPVSCKYRSAADGLACRNESLEGGEHCKSHTCEQPGCANVKSSRVSLCDEHASAVPGSFA